MPFDPIRGGLVLYVNPLAIALTVGLWVCLLAYVSLRAERASGLGQQRARRLRAHATGLTVLSVIAVPSLYYTILCTDLWFPGIPEDAKSGLIMWFAGTPLWIYLAVLGALVAAGYLLIPLVLEKCGLSDSSICGDPESLERINFLRIGARATPLMVAVGALDGLLLITFPVWINSVGRTRLRAAGISALDY